MGWKQSATATTPELTCSADVLVDGKFFGTPMAWVASALLALGAAGLILTLTSTISILNNRNGKWDARVMANAKRERDEEGRVHLRLGYSIRKTLVATLWGLLAGAGAFAICVGEAVGAPSISLALSVTLPFTLVGVLLGQLRLWAERRLVRRLTSPPTRSSRRRPALA